MQTNFRRARITALLVAALTLPSLLLIAKLHNLRKGDHGTVGKPTIATVDMAAPVSVTPKQHWTNAYDKRPLEFEANQGQTSADVRFLSRGNGYSLFLTGQEAVLTLHHSAPGVSLRLDNKKFSKVHRETRGAEKLSVLRMRFNGADPHATAVGVDRMPTRINYFVGNDPKKWHTDVPAYSKVKYQDVYPGVDLLFYGNQRRLEYDFIVAPGGDAKTIALDVQGASKLQIDQHGNLLMKVASGEVELQKPVVYQEVNGERHEIAGNYAISNNHEIRFSIANYDATRPLTIDPVLNYATYLGGTGADVAFGIALDAAGDAYIAGTTTSTDFPQQNPEPATPPTDIATNGTAFVSELNPAGTQLLYSTYLGGSGETNTGDQALAIAVDGSGNIYVTGFTGSPDFPTTAATALIPAAPGNSSGFGTGFITKLIPANAGTAQLGYSSYLGGSTEDQGNGIAVDSNGNAFIAGLTLSTDFPTTANAISTALLNPNGSAFLTEINTNAATGPASKVFSTYFGGTNGAGSQFLFGDVALGVAVDSSSNAYIVGTTTSTDFPTTAHLVSSCLTDTNGIAFVSVINTATPALTFSTCLGGANTETQGFGIGLGPKNIAYVTGQTTSPDFPVTANSIPPVAGVTNGVAFVSLLNTTSATPNQYSTFLGGTNGDIGLGIATDATSNAYVTGRTASADFPITQGAILETRKNPNGTGFISKINPGGNGQADLLYSSYFGGSGNGNSSDFDQGNGVAVSAANNAYITGQTSSPDLPVTSGVIQSKLLSATTNAFVADLPLISTISVSPTILNFGTQLIGTPTAAQFVTLTNNTSSGISLTLPPTFVGANPADFALAGGTCVTPLAAGAMCTVGVTFTPSIAAAETATLQIFDGADTASHPVQVALTGTGSTTAAVIAFSPTSLTFPGQLLTTTSTGQNLTISNPSTTTALSISAITSSSGFSIASNSCGSTFPISVAASPAGTPCVLSVTFAPTGATGPVTGAITVTDNANGSPQSVPLAGTAWDFSVSAPSSVTVAKGAMGTFAVTVTGLGGFTGPVAFACTPSTLISACAVPTTNAAPSPGATATATFTASAVIAPPQSMKVPPSVSLRQLNFVILAIALLLMIPSVRRFRTRVGMAGAILVFVLAAGCSSSPPAPQTSTITITPSSGGVTKPAITVNVSIMH
jgi:hypothetical protein